MHVLSIQPTPNPNAYKFVVDTILEAEGSRYYHSAPEAAADPLATALFAVPGVQTVYFAEDFATVTSAEDANLRTLHEQVTQVLTSHEGAGGVAVADSTPGAEADDPETLARINELLDDRVRPALAGDGGGLQVLRLEDKVLTIRYQGACGSCPSSVSGTLYAIQNLLQMEIDEALTVVNA